MSANGDVCDLAAYLNEVIAALRDRDVPVETGFISVTHPTGRALTVTLGDNPTSLSHATLSWQPAIGWSLTTSKPQPRQRTWALPPEIRPHPDEVASAVQVLITSLHTHPDPDRPRR